MRLNTTNSHTQRLDTLLYATANQVQSSVTVDDENTFAWEEDLLDIFSPANEESPLHFSAFAASSSEASGVAGAANENSESPEDLSGSLTRRLVAANNTFVIHRIIGDAFKNLGELRLALAMSDGEEADAKRQIIRRLERVIRRSNRKIRELNTEARMQQSQEKAEREEKLQRAREIENELRRQIERRRNRERGYLEQLMHEEMQEGAQQMLDAATEAAITAKAKSLAAQQIAAGMSGGSGGFDMSGGMPFSADSFGGAEGAGESLSSGELDVSV